MSQFTDQKLEKKNRKPKAKPSENNWLGFVEIELSHEQKVALSDSDRYADVDPFKLIVDFLDDGYKFSLTEDTAHGCFIATVTGKAEHCPNAGYSLMGRGGSAAQAIIVLAFKVYELAQGGVWSNYGGSTQRSVIG